MVGGRLPGRGRGGRDGPNPALPPDPGSGAEHEPESRAGPRGSGEPSLHRPRRCIVTRAAARLARRAKRARLARLAAVGITALFAPFAAPLEAQQLPGPSNAASAPLAYYFEEGERGFDPAIPSPEGFLGYEIGAHHTRHDAIEAYFRELARLSPRAVYEEYAESYERRRLGVLTVTSPDNHARLEEIRLRHLEAALDASVPAGDRPLVAVLAAGVHGGEASGPEAMLLTAYWLVAGTTPEVLEALERGVWHIDPVQNPDGRDRHVTWVNGNRSLVLSADPADREHTEGFPGGRTNHYLFDLNRDWLPLENPESRGKVAFHHRWLPNVVTDFHEMGPNSTYYFEPSNPVGSWNPLIPERLYTEITEDFAVFYADHLDRLGSLYFTKEVFDNTYPGYGSTYPKFLGGFALTFEQASSRGGVQESRHHGVLTYAYTIRNQLRTSLATVRGALAHREKLLAYQQEFFASALTEADAFPVTGYLFGDPHDPTKNRRFVEYLLRHDLEVHELARPVEAAGQAGEHAFEPGTAWVVPVRQPHYRLVRSIFERTSEYPDSTFYDQSTWTMSLAYGIPDAELTGAVLPLGARVTSPPDPPSWRVPPTGYAYLLDWPDSGTPRALQALLDRGVRVSTAFQPFATETHAGRREFGRGTLVIPVQTQPVGAAELHGWIEAAARDAEVQAWSVESGYSLEGVDLGSNQVRTIRPPSILLVLGGETGSIWHLFDTKVGIPATKVDVDAAARVDLARYNVIILPSSGGGAFTGERLEELRRWVRGGGTLITFRTGAAWAIRNGLAPNVALGEAGGAAGGGWAAGASGAAGSAGSGPVRRNYADASALRSQALGGSIWEADLDITHPLGFGYTRRTLAVWRDHGLVLPPSRNAFSTVARLTDEPHLSGYHTPEHLEALRGASSVVADRLGRGTVVLLVDQPNFRGFWLGTNRLLLNAVYFGEHVTVPGG
ncbi:MAG: hypothetical protein EA350_16195 [Gemmatimonadales bacterium]|nr:MAG: hypothetical protein EA350_16195 [Gemmatimonadales bacterium]